MTEENKKVDEKIEENKQAPSKDDVLIKEESKKIKEPQKTNSEDKTNKDSDKPLEKPIKEDKPKDEETESSKPEKQETKDDKTDEKPKEAVKTEKKPIKDDKKADKKDKSSDKKKEDEDFQYIVRIANTDLDGNKTVIFGVSQIKGIGRRLATIIIDRCNINRSKKIGKLTEKEIESIRVNLEKISDSAPSWMLNHRKDIETGKDIHLISTDIDLRLRDDVNLLKMIRSYRGVRHESNLPVRGQRTRANNRTGLTLGVSKKRQ